MEKKMAYKIAAVLVIGLFVFVSIALPIIAEATVSEGDTKVSVNDSGDGYIYWQEDGTEYMRLTGGKVGIGTTSPQNSLAVSGGVVIGSTYAGTASGSADGMVVEGQVGIGTTTLPAIFNTKTLISPQENHGGGTQDDCTFGGAYTESEVRTYKVQIDGIGAPDTFKWSDDGGSSWVQTLVPIVVGPFALNYGVEITFGATTGHTNGEWWTCQLQYYYPLMLFNAADTLLMHVDNGGKVGIGQTEGTGATARLDVNPTITRTDDYTGIKSGLTYNGASAMTKWYGAYIEAPGGSGTITNKYALVTESGAGNVGFGTVSPVTTLDVNGGLATEIVTKTADYTATSSDFTILVNAGSNTDINLPTASSVPGQILVIKRIDSSGNTVKIIGTFDGTTDPTLSQWDSYILQSNGSNWYILADK